MVFPQVIAGFHALIEAIGLPANLLVIVTIALERRFHVMRYILLASLAASDSLLLILANSFRIASTAQERWLFGQTMCYLNPFFARYFYFNTVLHLIAVSYERYSAIVKSPMTYDGTITKSRVVLMICIWVAPIPLSIGPFVGWGQYVYNPEVFFCEQAWGVHSDSTARTIVISAIITLVVPSLIIAFLNWSVFKTRQDTAKTLQRNVVQVGDLAGSDTSESQMQENARRRSERKAAVDVCIIIAAFMVCFLPSWTVGFCRQFLKSSEVPAEAILVTSVIFFASTLCNPIIYSIRKRDFRAGVKNVFRWMGVCGSPNDTNNNEIGMNNFTFRANLGTGASAARPTAPQATQDHDERFNGSTGRAELTFQASRLSPIQEVIE
ncbi:octopamine receptor beta-2R-like [Oculina patagonica]